MKHLAGAVRRFRRAVPAAAAVGALSALVAACGQGQAVEAPRALAEVVRQDLAITAEATGQLEPLRTVEVKSKASGEVTAVLVDTGDRVEPGTLLVRIDPRDVQNEHNQAQADYEVARERHDIAEAQFLRSERLLASGVITEQEHEGRSLEYANTRSNLVRARTNLELARLRLDDVTIRSPLSGTVLEKTVEEGVVIASASGNVSGGTTLLTIANLDVVQVRTLVDETDVGRIQTGMPATVRVEAFPDRTFEGKVEKIEPQATVQQNVVMFPVIVHLDNRDGSLKPGMSAEVTVLVAERPATLTLPNNAIVSVNEVSAAAAVLGLDPTAAEIDRTAFQELSRQVMVRRGASEEEAAVAGRAGAGPEGLEELRARVQRGEISQDSLRALMRSAMAGGGGAPGARRGGEGTRAPGG